MSLADLSNCLRPAARGRRVSSARARQFPRQRSQGRVARIPCPICRASASQTSKHTPVFSACCTDRSFDRAPRADLPPLPFYACLPLSSACFASAQARLFPALLPFMCSQRLEPPQGRALSETGPGGVEERRLGAHGMDVGGSGLAGGWISILRPLAQKH